MKTTRRQRVVVKPKREVSLQNRLQDLYSAADMTVSLGLRMKQKLFGEAETASPRGERSTPVCAEGYLAAISDEIAKANGLLEELNQRVQAD